MVHVAEDTPADTHDYRSVTLDQHPKRLGASRIVAAPEPLQKLAIVQIAQDPKAKKRLE